MNNLYKDNTSHDTTKPTETNAVSLDYYLSYNNIL